MVRTFAENDAGFPYVLKTKGEAAYDKHTASIRDRISNCQTEREYVDLLNEWLYFFRKGHIGISKKETDVLSALEKDSVRNSRKNLERVDLDRAAFDRYLKENAGKLDPVEGVWKSRYNKSFGIIRSQAETNRYKAFAIDMFDTLYWQPGQLFAELKLLDDGRYRVFTEGDTATLKWAGGAHQILRSSWRNDWVKVEPRSACSTKDSLYKEVAAGTIPFVKRLDAKTLYMRLPSFQVNCKRDIDRMLAQNDKRIRSTPILIIDIRNGTGGSDASWQGLLPYFYTQPIRHPGLRFRAGPSNMERVLKSGNQAMADQMKANMGGFVDVKGDTYTVKGLTPTAFPQKIAIICNHRNASSDESLLFEAKQSFKVKVFGTSTAGMLDFSNLNLVDFPNQPYVLWLAMSETKGFEKYSVDAAGMHPDFFIPDEVDETDWIDYVRKTLEQ